MRMAETDIIETFSYLVNELKRRHPNMAYLHAIEPEKKQAKGLEAAAGHSLEFLVSLCIPGSMALMPFSTRYGLINR
jgi:hypothetical protein